jgi:hypothetical protein
MAFITIVTGAYKPTYNWEASHCRGKWASPVDVTDLILPFYFTGSNMS